MNLLRKLLMRLRDERSSNRKKSLIVLSVFVGMLSVISFLIDFLLPFGSWYMVIRSLLLVPTALSIFSLSYMISLDLHYIRQEHTEGWVPFRLRYSPTWRLRIAAIVFAVLIVFVYASKQAVGYTFFSSVVAASVLALLAFIRTTKQEAQRIKLGIPDSRDLTYDAAKRGMIEEREHAKREKILKKSSKKDAEEEA